MTDNYVLGQLSRAFVTATTHEDQDTRERADRRAEQWMRVIEATSSGTVTIGSRTPVAGFPSWVSFQVLRGGFATGAAVADGPLELDEIALAAELGATASRETIFSHYLTDRGLAELYALLDSRRYRVASPEDAALAYQSLGTYRRGV